MYTYAHIALEMKQDTLMGWPVHNLQNPDSCADGKAKEERYSEKKQETYEAKQLNISVSDEKSSHNEVVVTCIDGEISKNQSRTLMNHITIQLSHNPIKPHMCHTCGKEFGVFERLKIHMDTHIGIERHMCEACGEEFGTFDTLKRHVEAHVGIKKHKCGTCGKEFGRSDYLKTHITRTGHKHICMICRKAFTRSGQLKKHITTHIIETILKPHELMISNEEESVRFEKLKNHGEAHHGGIEKHKCGTCGMEFRRSGYLKTHMIKHSGLKKHKCMICSKAFGRSCDLTRHMVVHTGIKKHKCMICSKAFGRSSTLRKHMTTHTVKTTVTQHELMILDLL